MGTGNLALLRQMEEILPQLLFLQLIGRQMKMPGQLTDGLDIDLLRGGRQTVPLHIFQKTLT